jgi:hypothetical protein
VQLPHELLAALGTHYPDDFASIMGLDSVSRFWSAIADDDPRMCEDPVRSVPDRRKVVPLWAFGDGVEFSTDTLMTACMGSVLACDVKSPLLLAAWPKAATRPARPKEAGNTWGPIWECLCWSFRWCWEGVHPRTDLHGRAWAAGTKEGGLAGQPLVPGHYRFALWQVQGDWEWYARHLSLPSWNAQSPCWLCDATAAGGDRRPDWCEES